MQKVEIMPKAYLILLIAVFAETVGTTALQASQLCRKELPVLP